MENELEIKADGKRIIKKVLDILIRDFLILVNPTKQFLNLEKEPDLKLAVVKTFIYSFLGCVFYIILTGEAKFAIIAIPYALISIFMWFFIGSFLSWILSTAAGSPSNYQDNAVVISSISILLPIAVVLIIVSDKIYPSAGRFVHLIPSLYGVYLWYTGCTVALSGKPKRVAIISIVVAIIVTYRTHLF